MARRRADRGSIRRPTFSYLSGSQRSGCSQEPAFGPTTDPLAPDLSNPYPSAYTYADNNPLTQWDPTGQRPWGVPKLLVQSSEEGGEQGLRRRQPPRRSATPSTLT